MTDNKARYRVLVYSDDQQAIAVFNKVFSSLASLESVVRSIGKFTANSDKDIDDFDVLFVDLGDGAALTDGSMKVARGRVNHRKIIFFSDSLPAEGMRAVMRLDGLDWLPKPLQSRSIVDALAAVIKKRASSKNIVHAVLSAGGGAGGTSVAIMLAYYLTRARKREKPTGSIVDLDFTKGSVGAYLNVPNPYDLASVLSKPERVDVEFINAIRKAHSSGFGVFSFESPEVAASPSAGDLVLRMLDVVAYQHDHTVLDMPPGETLWKNQVLKTVNTVTIVCTNTVPSLQRAKDLLRNATRMRESAADIHVIINRVKTGLFGFGSGIGKREIGKIFGTTPVHVLPEESGTLIEAINRGVLPIVVNPRSKFCHRLEKVTESYRSLTERKV